jgi:ribonuclease Z
VHERPFLIDCGEGTQMQLRRNHIRFGKINHIFISHIHGDHVFGLYGLISSLNLMGRKVPLTIYAPAGYGEIMFSHLADFDIHTDFEIRFLPLSGKDPVKILDEKFVTVTAFPLKHRIPAFGFMFRQKEGERKILKEAISKYSIPVSQIRFIKCGADFIAPDGTIVTNDEITTSPPRPLSYAYCSDTSVFSRLAGFVSGVDLLYHEATFDASKKELARKTGHSTTEEAASTAIGAGAGTLLIGHFSARYRDVDSLVEEARKIFPRTIAAREGITIDVAECRASQ